MKVAIYLRKSRADEEAERRGEGETLAKHKKALLKLARHLNANVVQIREEIVSGESLVHRPEMLQLLKDVEAKEYDAVLVMDIDRFGRGNMQEQGLILETFRNAKTKIVTPRKTYDLTDEFDEEYSEFEAFMARKELKIITRRMQGGRVRSVEEGNYLGTRPPYGYEIEELPNGRTLKPHPIQADIVRQIFAWYTITDPLQQKGSSKIATELNRLTIPSYSGKAWTPPSVIGILKNAVYIGRIQWKKKESKKSKEVGKRRVVRLREIEDWIDVQGKHPALIDEETFYKAKERLVGKYHVPFQLDETGKPKITTALAGLVRCNNCGMTMVYRPYTGQKAHLRCNTSGCSTRSSQYSSVETKIIEGLEDWLTDYKIKWGKQKKGTSNDSIKFKQTVLNTLEKEIQELEKQKERLFDFLERGIYTEEVFLERSQNLSQRITETSVTIAKTVKELSQEHLRQEAQLNVIPMVETVVKTYYKTNDPVKRNALLKSVLYKVDYKKQPHQRGNDFEIVLHPRL
ncbi:recombinase family protein [Paenibacillus sp. NRS-1783]|uniref:recombinase family protein n=1 Tax=Paenibacillus sp. NRS-1783 TaxID=3233907 RepID=UPI003D28D02D